MYLPTDSQLFAVFFRPIFPAFQDAVRPVVLGAGHQERFPRIYASGGVDSGTPGAGYFRIASKASVYLRLWVSVPRKE